MNISKFIEDLSSQKIELWREGDRLRYRGPKEVLNSATLNQIKQYKTNILAWLSEQDSLPKVYPLSEGQKALWFIYKLAPDSCAYNIAFNARIRSQVDIPTLKKTFQYLSDRHPILRTTFREEGGNPIQEIKPHQEICFEVVEVGQESEENLYQQVFEAYQRPFNLEEGPLMRVSLFHCSDEDYILLITIHHIVSDAWSLWGLLDELKIVYPALKSNISPSLPPLRRSYADFVNWQQKMLNDSEGERLWNYWQRKLGGDLPTLQLPTDKPRPPIQTYRGESLSFQLTQELSDKLRGLARSEGTSLFTLMLTAFQVLLHRYTGQNDILIGSPTTGRTQTDFEKVFGYFVNPVVIRANLSNNHTFKELLNQTRQNVLEAISNQDYPFPLLVRDLQPDRDPSYSPLFQVDFTWQQAQEGSEILKLLMPNQTQTQVKLGELLFEPFTIPQQEGQFDLSLDVIDTKQKVVGVIKYNTDLFEKNTIQRMIGHFQVLLEGIVGNPKQSISQLPILTQSERHQLLVEWNKTQADYPQDKCIHQLFEEQVAKTPDAIAVVYQEQQLTYRELNERANQLAHYLQKLEVQPDDLVGICVERSLEMVIGLLGILKSGGAYVPLEPNSPMARINHIVSDSQIKLLIAQNSLISSLPKNQAEIIVLDQQNSSWLQDSTQNLTCQNQPSNLAYVIYTSGSTGKPKGVLIEHANVTRLFSATQSWYNFNEKDVWTMFHSYAFDFSVWELWGGLFYGGRVVIIPYFISRSPQEFYQLLCQEKVTVLNQTPSAFQQLIRVDEDQIEQKIETLRLVIFGGEALDIPALKPWFERYGDQQPQLVNMYGITETTVHVTYRPLTKADLNNSSSVIGCPIPDLQVYILDQNLEPVPIGVPGEICVGGDGVGRGYLNRNELTEQKFVPHPFSEKSNQRLYRSGDLARYLPNGDIEYLGRIDHQVKIRGFRIELGEIESLLSNHPDVSQVVVIAREKNGVKQLLAYFVSKLKGQELERQNDLISSLRQYLGEKLPDYMIPSAFIWLEQLPLTANGKVDRKALPSPDTELIRSDDYVAPQNSIEIILTNIWQSVLGIEKVSTNDNFFEIGGDSILSIQVVSRAREQGVKISPKQIFQNQSIAELALVAETSLSISNEQGLVTGSAPLTPIQNWFLQQNWSEPHYYNQSVVLQTRGKIDPNLLSQSINKLLEHHDALRLRFIQSESGWQQINQGRGETLTVKVVDLSQIPDADRSAIMIDIANSQQASLNISKGPLMKVILFNSATNDNDNFLLIIIHHLVVDGVSWRILLEDLSQVYRQLTMGEQIKLPPKTTAFRDWAIQLKNHANSSTELNNELNYWLNVPWSQVNVSGLPVDHNAPTENNLVSTEEIVLRTLSTEQTQKLLQEVPSAYNTQVNDVLLTALAKTLSDLTGQLICLIDLEGHGREYLWADIDISRTVGWFTSIFPVFLQLPETKELGAIIKSVKEQLRDIPHKGFNYSILRYLHPDSQVRSQLSNLHSAQIVFNYLGKFEPSPSSELDWQLNLSSLGKNHSSKGHRPYLLSIDSFVLDEKLKINCTYSSSFYDQSTIEMFADNYIERLNQLIDHCLAPHSGGYTPSDVPDIDFSQEELDDLLNEINY